MNPRSVTLLGTGYTGAALLPLLASRKIRVSSTRRTTPADGNSQERRLLFRLEDPSTWTSLPASDATVWILPAQPVDLVRRLVTERGERLGRCVVIGSTSAYVEGEDRGTVNEFADLDEHQERVRGENFLMERGAIVLRSAGIYGPALGEHRQRNPLDWLRAGRIASADDIVNLVHVADLARSIMAALDSAIAGDHFIVSDGRPRRWGEIAEWAREQGFVEVLHYGGGERRRRSRRLSNRKLLERLAPELHHTDLFAELRRLERGQQTEA